MITLAVLVCLEAIAIRLEAIAGTSFLYDYFGYTCHVYLEAIAIRLEAIAGTSFLYDYFGCTCMLGSHRY